MAVPPPPPSEMRQRETCRFGLNKECVFSILVRGWMVFQWNVDVSNPRLNPFKQPNPAWPTTVDQNRSSRSKSRSEDRGSGLENIFLIFFGEGTQVLLRPIGTFVLTDELFRFGLQPRTTPQCIWDTEVEMNYHPGYVHSAGELY